MICHSEEICKVVSSGLVSDVLARRIVSDFYVVLKSYKTPVGHGTSSEYFGSIVEHGLGGKTPKRASRPGTIAVTDLRLSDGLLGAYAFALREEVFRLFRKNLCVDATQRHGRSVIHRYVASMGLKGVRAYAARCALAYIGAVYCFQRGRKNGWPSLLIYDVGDDIPLAKEGAAAPSEYYAKQVVFPRYLKLVMVPARCIGRTVDLLSDYELDYRIVPLEVLELEEEVLARRRDVVNLSER